MCTRPRPKLPLSKTRKDGDSHVSIQGFSPRANDAINLALSQACLLGHTYIGSEHLLLGLLLEGSGPSAALTPKGVTPTRCWSC